MQYAAVHRQAARVQIADREQREPEAACLRRDDDRRTRSREGEGGFTAE